MSKDIHLTQAGVDELKNELQGLVARRVDVAAKLKAAKEQGDLSENSDYTSAREEQAYVEARIAEIEEILRNVEIIETPTNSKKVALGSTVTLDYNGNSMVYTIVGSVESDPLENKISDESPIGQSLLGKKVGDTVEISAPSGTIAYKVAKIQ